MSDQQQHSEPLSDRLKELSGDLKQQFTHLEQEPPNSPSFLLVVLLSGAAIIIIFILAILVLHLDGGKFGRRSFSKHPTSQLVLPSGPACPAAHSPDQPDALRVPSESRLSQAAARPS